MASAKQSLASKRLCFAKGPSTARSEVPAQSWLSTTLFYDSNAAGLVEVPARNTKGGHNSLWVIFPGY